MLLFQLVRSQSISLSSPFDDMGQRNSAADGAEEQEQSNF